MFTVQPVSNSGGSDTHAINTRFENESQTVQEMTSHDLGNPGDLDRGDGHTLEQIGSQCPPPLSQSDVTSVQGSYVSLLADIATIEQNDEYSDQPITHDISDTVDYTATTFTGQDLTPLQNENMVSYQSIDNSNIGYNLANTVGNTQGIQQFVIIQPFLGDTSVNTQNTFINLTNTGESQLNLDSNKELEDAVANITDTAVAGDAGVDSSEGGVSADESFLVCTNNRGEVREIQVIQGKPAWNENKTQAPLNKRKGRLKSVDEKRRRSGFTERKESTSHLKKFSPDELNSGGKSKKEIYEEYLEKSKEKSSIESLESKVIESLQETQSEVDKVSFSKDCSRNIDEGSREEKSLNELDVSITAKNKAEIVWSRQISDEVPKTHGKMLKLKECSKDTNSESNSCIKETDFTKLKKKEIISLKRKKSEPDLEEPVKIAKNDNLDTNRELVEDKALDNDIESRMMNDFCRLFRSDEKCVLHLEPITLKLLNPNRFLTIEMDIEKDFVVSTVEKGETKNGLTKYCVKITAPENALLTKSEDINSSEISTKKKCKTNKLKCLKRSRLKCKRTLLKGKKVISGLKKIQKPLKNEENTIENTEVLCVNSDCVDKVAVTEVDSSTVEIGADAENEEEIKTKVSESETTKQTDISSNNDVNDTKDKITDSECKQRKTKNFTEKKNQKTNQNSTDGKKDESSQNYTVLISEEGMHHIFLFRKFSEIF